MAEQPKKFSLSKLYRNTDAVKKLVTQKIIDIILDYYARDDIDGLTKYICYDNHNFPYDSPEFQNILMFMFERCNWGDNIIDIFIHVYIYFEIYSIEYYEESEELSTYFSGQYVIGFYRHDCPDVIYQLNFNYVVLHARSIEHKNQKIEIVKKYIVELCEEFMSDETKLKFYKYFSKSTDDVTDFQIRDLFFEKTDE